MIGRFTKTTIEDWKGRDCCRLDFRGTDTRSPYFGDPSLWDDEGEEFPLSEALEYISGRRTLEGVILGGEPMRTPGLFKILKDLRKTRMPIRIETCGNRPAEIDDYAGALMVDSILVRLMASPYSEIFSDAMPGIDASNVIETLELLPELDAMTEIEIIAIPGITTADDIKDIAKNLGKRTILTIRQFDAKCAPDAKMRSITPYKKSEAIELSAAAKPFTNKAALRGF